MAAANFETMRDFPLFVNNYIVQAKRCPICGAVQDEDNDVCEACGSDELEDYCYEDELECSDAREAINAKLDDVNCSLLFHKIELKDGYYGGIQFYVDVKYDLTADNYDNDECHYYFDLCRSVAYRKYQAEINRIIRSLQKLAKEYGYTEVVCTARFSNGEAVFSPASSPRARLYSAVVA